VGVTALVMAGGRGTRMALSEEKPLVMVGGKAMIECVIDALRGARKVEDIVVAVSKDTPKTAVRARELSAKPLDTPGEGYVSDLRYAVRRLGPRKILTVSADLPLITSAIIDRIVGRYEDSGRPALTVAAPTELYERLGLKPEYVFEIKGRTVAPVGVNVVDGGRIEEPEMEEEILILEDEALVINVNTLEDLGIAEKELRRRAAQKVER